MNHLIIFLLLFNFENILNKLDTSNLGDITY